MSYLDYNIASRTYSFYDDTGYKVMTWTQQDLLVREPNFVTTLNAAQAHDPADYLWPPEPQVGGLEAGPARYMGTPCPLPAEGLKVRLRRYMGRWRS